MSQLPDLTEFGLNYTGQCNCPGRPHRWRGGGYEMKYFRGTGVWRLSSGSKRLRFGSDINSAYDEIKEYYQSLAQ